MAENIAEGNDFAQKDEEVIYDEVHAYLSQGLYPLEATKQEKCIIRKRSKNFSLLDGVLYYCPIQQQSGLSDCGIFAIAFAVHLLLDDRVEIVEFDQSQMRQHLLKCLKDRKFSPFPTKKKCGYRSRHVPFREIELFCTCLMPETYREEMIECETCEQWFHTDCVGLLPDYSVAEHWYCNTCR